MFAFLSVPSTQCHNGHLGDNAFFSTNPMDSVLVIIKRDKIPHFLAFAKILLIGFSLSL